MYRLCLVLHLLAATLWLGHMFFWSLFSGPALKRIQPPNIAARLREVSLRMGALGWPGLVVLTGTGAYLLAARGIGLDQLLSADFRSSAPGRVVAVKLALVGAMVCYQAAFGHRPAPRAIHANMLVALLVLAASVMLARGAW